MGSPSIFSGRRTKLLTADGILNSNGSLNDYDGVRNYILNGHAEVNAAGWVRYAEGATARPITGSGGTPNITWDRTTGVALTGQASFSFAKTNVNRQGNGVSYDFTIPDADKAKVLKIEFDYRRGSGTFTAGTSTTDSDIIVYIYDITNAVLIEPSSFKLFSNSNTVTDRFSAYFQTNSNSNNYRLIFHVATTSTSIYTVVFDNISVSPSQYVYGTPITDWRDYTPTITSASGTLTNFSLTGTQWMRAGQNIYIRGQLTFTGSPGTWNSPRISLPNGYTVFSNYAAQAFLQSVYLNDNGTNSFVAQSNIVANNNYVAFGGQNGASNQGTVFDQGSPFTWVSGDSMTWLIGPIPINGLSSSVQMSDSADTRVVSLSAQTAGTLSVTANTTLITYTAIRDTHGAWDGDEYTVPVSGDYQVAAGSQSASAHSVYAQVNGATPNGFPSIAVLYTAPANAYNSGALILPNLKAGDKISFKSDASVTLTVSRNASISRISGPSAIAATETIAASYWMSSNKTVNTTTPADFDSREFDSHLAVTTGASWRFTAPASGLYRVSMIGQNGGTNTVRSIYKNGTSYKTISRTSTTFGVGAGSTEIRLIGGDFIDIRSSASETMLGTTLNGDNGSNISIVRIGL